MQLARFLEFLAGYAAVLATPGPNLLAVCSMAALRGLRCAIPLCLGIALGAAALSAALLIAAAIVEAGRWRNAGQLIGAALLGWVAFSVARLPPPGERDTCPRGEAAAVFGAGFCTAAANPLTAAFFAAQFLGPLAKHRALMALAPIAVAATALGFFLCVAVLLARPGCRAMVLAWHRPVRLAAASVLALLAAVTAAKAL